MYCKLFALTPSHKKKNRAGPAPAETFRISESQRTRSYTYIYPAYIVELFYVDFNILQVNGCFMIEAVEVLATC